ncbi:MAG TPA: hypothetical protein VFG86_16090, partial [Chloroflexota bacterium]|nr:hypothetical protein [Chloroflexota bacterium]
MAEPEFAPEAMLRELLALQNPEARQARLALAIESSSGDEIDALLSAVKDVSEQHLVADAGVSLSLANLLVHGAELVDQPRHRALGLLAKADALRIQGQFAAAVELYEQAGRLCLQLDDGITWARTRTGWVLAMHYLGRGQEALPTAEQAYRVLFEAGEWLRAGGLSLNSGLVCYELGQYSRSNELYQRALELYQRAAAARPELADRARERIARAQTNMALNSALLGDFSSAIAL